MHPLTRHARGVSLAVSLLALGACSGSASLEGTGADLTAGKPFVRVGRDATALTGPATKAQGLDADGGPTGFVTGGNDSFYLAINKNELGKRWFLSAFLTQWHPSEAVPDRSLGTRVVTFKVQNGKLYVFDAADGKAWSDTLDPTVIVEAYPLVSLAAFNALPGASNYVLFDPSAGLNRFSFVSDDVAATTWARFQVDLAYMQRFRALADGVSFEQVFTGYTESPGVGGVGTWDQPFRGAGTLAISLRRYAEGAGFTPTELAGKNYFGSSNVQYVKNQPALKQYAIKWNLHPGMQPIPWRISKAVDQLRADPRLAGIDVAGAIERGVTGWNTAFGFQAFQVVPTGPDDAVGDDDKNFIIVDNNPGAGLAFANWRENPNTGELRGASVYFSSVFIEGALQQAPLPDGGVVEPLDAGAPVADAGAAVADAGPALVPCSPEVVLSQVFGGGSLSGAYNQDYVELHNRSAQAVSLAGWSVQYASAAGTSWQVVALPASASVPPGGFYLVGLAAADGGVGLPALDALGGVNLSASAGKVALVRSAVALSGACPTGAVDLVGYGATAACSEGAAPAPAPSSATALLRRDAASACTDTDVNGQDFVLAAPAPRNAASLASLCTCTALGVTPAPGPATDGGVQRLPPPAARPAARLSWDALQASVTCELKHDLATALVPAGMSRRDFIEAVITHTVVHEIGHTLGLRHNFKGSLAGSSVMDYLRDEDGVLLTAPGAYDVAAVKKLYGLDPAGPTQPFCTDEDRATDAECEIFDSGPTPLTADVGPAFTAKVRGLLAEKSGLSYGDIWAVTRYVRGPASEAQRLDGFNVLLGDVAPPVRPEISALGPNANAWADLLAGLFLQNLFLDPKGYRDPIGLDPLVTDPTFRARAVAVTKGLLVNSDKVRSFERRRIAIDVLKAMQTLDAYQALIDARASLLAERATYNPTGQALIDDLVRRLDLAMLAVLPLSARGAAAPRRPRRSACGPARPAATARSADGVAAVHHQGVPGHEARRVGGEVQRRAGELVGLRVAAERGAARHQGAELLVAHQRRGELRLHQPRRDGVDADAGRAQLGGQRLGHRDDRRLGHAVHALHRRRAQARHAGHVDDGARGVARGEVPHHLAGGEEVAAGVDLEGLVPGGVLHLEHRPEVRVGGGVVHQHVHLAELLHRLGDEALHVLQLAGVGGDGQRAAALLRDARGHRLEGVGLARGQHHLRPGAGEGEGDGLPDAAGGSGDDGDLVGEVDERLHGPAHNAPAGRRRAQPALRRRRGGTARTTSRRRAARRGSGRARAAC